LLSYHDEMHAMLLQLVVMDWTGSMQYSKRPNCCIAGCADDHMAFTHAYPQHLPSPGISTLADDTAACACHSACSIRCWNIHLIEFMPDAELVLVGALSWTISS
jgi:hypothetical protein